MVQDSAILEDLSEAEEQRIRRQIKELIPSQHSDTMSEADLREKVLKKKTKAKHKEPKQLDQPKSTHNFLKRKQTKYGKALFANKKGEAQIEEIQESPSNFERAPSFTSWITSQTKKLG